jgi:hypothetical protein
MVLVYPVCGWSATLLSEKSFHPAFSLPVVQTPDRRIDGFARINPPLSVSDYPSYLVFAFDKSDMI